MDAAQPRDSLTCLRILVVEDEQDTRELLDRLLRSYGAHILLARSADEALSRLSDGHVDLVVSDIGLPDIDGYDTYALARL
jgi:CheY-like chemotaxis protein